MNHKNNIQLSLSLFLLLLMLLAFILLLIHFIFFLIFKIMLNLEIKKLKKKCKNIEFKFGKINRHKFKIFKSYFNLNNFYFKNKKISLKGNAYIKNNKILVYYDEISLINNVSYYYFYKIELSPNESYITYKRFILFFWITKKIKVKYIESPVNIFKISDECIICYDKKAINIPISECGHVGFCSDCYCKLNECPYCRCKYLDSSCSSYCSSDDY